MPNDFGAKWIAFLGRMILIAAGAERQPDEEESLLSLRTGLITVIGFLFLVPVLLRVMPEMGELSKAFNAENWLQQALPLALILTVTLSLINLLGFLYNVRSHFPRRVLLLPLGYAIGLEAIWRWVARAYQPAVIAAAAASPSLALRWTRRS